jgi:hypothetical protein
VKIAFYPIGRICFFVGIVPMIPGKFGGRSEIKLGAEKILPNSNSNDQ